MNSDPVLKSAGRWALTTSILTAFSLIMCAGFADQASHKLGLSPKLFYIPASIAVIIGIVLHISSDGSMSQRILKALAAVQSVLLLGLLVPMCMFIVEDAKGGVISIPSLPDSVIPPTPIGQVIGSIAFVSFFCVGAILSLIRLVRLNSKL